MPVSPLFNLRDLKFQGDRPCPPVFCYLENGFAIRDADQVSVFDPVGMEPSKKVLNTVTYVENLYDVANDADAMVIITEWNEFRYLDWGEIKKRLRSPVVFDLRNIYDPYRMRVKGFDYYCVGRGYEPSA